jgi:hypothetical protein
MFEKKTRNRSFQLRGMFSFNFSHALLDFFPPPLLANEGLMEMPHARVLGEIIVFNQAVHDALKTETLFPELLYVIKRDFHDQGKDDIPVPFPWLTRHRF